MKKLSFLCSKSFKQLNHSLQKHTLNNKVKQQFFSCPEQTTNIKPQLRSNITFYFNTKNNSCHYFQKWVYLKHLPTHSPDKHSSVICYGLMIPQGDEFKYKSCGGDTEESITRLWDRFEACFIFSMVDTVWPFLRLWTGVKYSRTIECEHCHINITKSIVFVMSELQLSVMHTKYISISMTFVQWSVASQASSLSLGRCARGSADGNLVVYKRWSSFWSWEIPCESFSVFSYS